MHTIFLSILVSTSLPGVSPFMWLTWVGAGLCGMIFFGRMIRRSNDDERK